MRIDYANMKKITLPITILLASFILGGFYYTTEVKKQELLNKEYEIKLQQDQKEKRDLEDKKIAQENKTIQDSVSLETVRTENAENCVKKGQETAVQSFYIECISNKNVGGSVEKCPIIDSAKIIQYIREEKAISLGVFEIDKQLTTDLQECAALYGK